MRNFSHEGLCSIESLLRRKSAINSRKISSFGKENEQIMKEVLVQGCRTKLTSSCVIRKQDNRQCSHILAGQPLHKHLTIELLLSIIIMM